MDIPGLPIIQINLHHSKGASAILVRAMAKMQTGLALVQEPWQLDGAIKGLGGGGRLFHDSSEGRARACILTRGLEATFLPQVSTKDLTVISLNTKFGEEGPAEILVGSAYMPYDSADPPPPIEVRNLIEYANDRGLELLLGCDANSHHYGWGSSDVNPRGESLQDFIMGAGLLILNRGHEFTFMDSRRREVVDLTLCTNGLSDKVQDWRVSQEPSGSDHRQIHMSLQHTQAAVWRRCREKTDWVGFRAALKAWTPSIPTNFRNREELEAAATRLRDVLVDAYEANCPETLVRGRTKVPWWNEGLAETRKEVRRALNKAKRTNRPEHWRAHRDLQRRYSKEIVVAKRKSWRAFCESIESAPEASRLNRILSQDSKPQLGCLKRPDGSYTENTEESLCHLMETHFPGFRSLAESDAASQPRPNTGGRYAPREWALAAQIVHPKGVEWAIRTFHPLKAAGPDGVFPALLQEGLGQILGPLTKILRASIAHRHIPDAWRGTTVVFIPKPGRNGHVLAKDFRPISLTSFVLKTLERLVDRHLKNGPLTTHPLSDSQYAYREGRSTDTALHHLVSKIESQLTAKGYALGVFLDIEGAFDSTSYKVIKEALTRLGAPEALVDWTQSMLATRILTVKHNGLTLSGTPAKGCPQGGVLSPLLWCLVVDELLVRLKKLGVNVYGYADDVAIVVRGNFLQELKELMERALQTTVEWSRAKGLAVNPRKTQAMIFTKKYKPTVIQPLRMGDGEVGYSSTVKYLGVYLDPKLNWNHHLEEKLNKFYTSYWACRRAMGKTWGLKTGIALWLYRAILLPRLLYAAVAWWPAVGRVSYEKKLSSLQGRYLRAAARVMKTTPTAALEVAFNFLPLNINITGQARLSAYRLMCMGSWKSTGTGHTELGLAHISPFTHQQDRIPRKFQIIKTFKTLIRTREEWRKTNMNYPPMADAWFTDGSGANGRYGAGVFNPKTKTRVSLPMGRLATVFQAEVLAIRECMRLCLERGTKGRHVLVHSDSRAAINALAKPHTDSAIVWDSMQLINEVGENNKITLVWIPGHQGFYGNEEADRLAKLGTEEEPVRQMVGIPFAIGKSFIQSRLKRQHLHLWQTREECRQAKLLMIAPTPNRTKELLTLGRARLRLGIGLLTGHNALRSHMHKLGLAEQRECRLCGAEEESSVHILCHCPVLAIKRYKIWGKTLIDPGEVANTKITTICSLAEKAGLGC